MRPKSAANAVLPEPGSSSQAAQSGITNASTASGSPQRVQEARARGLRAPEPRRTVDAPARTNEAPQHEQHARHRRVDAASTRRVGSEEAQAAAAARPASARIAAEAARERVLSSAVSRLRSLLLNLGLASVTARGAARSSWKRRPGSTRAAGPARPGGCRAAHQPLPSRARLGQAARRRSRASAAPSSTSSSRSTRAACAGPTTTTRSPPARRRVLILGDSFAEGYYVDEPETARAVLEKRLNAGPCGAGRW